MVLLRDERDQLLAHERGQQERADLAICASEPSSIGLASDDDEARNPRGVSRTADPS